MAEDGESPGIVTAHGLLETGRATLTEMQKTRLELGTSGDPRVRMEQLLARPLSSRTPTVPTQAQQTPEGAAILSGLKEEVFGQTKASVAEPPIAQTGAPKPEGRVQRILNALRGR